MSMSNHPYHLVNISPWPILASFNALVMMSGMIKWFHMFNSNLLILSSIIMILISSQWWRDVVRESTFQGFHTLKVSLGLRWGMILFITSEVFFFISFFWTFFHSSLTPNIDIGSLWPPKGILPFNPMEIPLLNTLILLTSGLTVTWAHHSIIENNFYMSMYGLQMTVLLGLYFSLLQMFEYNQASFTMADAIYGSIFFMTTGFHGIHVIIGSIFLLVCLIRLMNLHFSPIHHFGFEAAAWYWHFVDVVWLFVYTMIYWWGS